MSDTWKKHSKHTMRYQYIVKEHSSTEWSLNGTKRGNGRPLHAWIHKQVTYKVPTCYTYKSTTSAIQIYPHPIWSQGPTRRITRHLRPSYQRSNQNFPIHHRNTTLLWTIRRPKHSHWSKWNCVLSSQSHRIIPQCISPTPWLNSNSYQHSYHIPWKLHDRCTLHWCILPLWTRWQNPSRCIHVSHQ